MQEATWDQLLVGGSASTVNLIIHALLLAAIVRTVQTIRIHDLPFPGIMQRTLVIYATGMLLLAAHFLEVKVWAFTYELVDAAPQGTPLVYFAFSNYTTLGYGDIVPAPEWRLLGPITALNGIMLIGWSTALVYAVLRSGVVADHFLQVRRKQKAPEDQT